METTEQLLEESLRERENAYRTLAENLPGMVYRVFIRENSRMEFFNKMLEPMTGYTAEELTAGEVCSIEPLILLEDRGAVVRTVQHAILDHQPFEVEYRFRNKRGEVRYFHERGRPIYGEDGGPLYIDGLIFDITERKLAEEVLLFKENIVKHSSSVIATCDLEGNMTYGNPSFLRTWGFDNPEEFLGRPFWEFWLVEDRLDEIMQALRGNGAWFGEIKARRKDDQIFDVQVSAAMVFDSRGNPVALTSTSTDITDRKKMEDLIQESHRELEKKVEERTKELREEIAHRKQTQEALGESENRFTLFMKHLPGSAFIKDHEGRILYVNEYVEKMFNCKIEDFVGKMGKDFWPPDLAAKVKEDDDYVISTGRSIEKIEDVEHGGKWAPFLTFKFPIFRPGLPPLLGGMSIDITHRKRAEEALRESEKRLRFLSSQLIIVQEQERKRIAGELHEGLGALLSGIKYKVEVALQQRGRNKLKAVEAQLESVIPMIQESVEEVRRIHTGLRPVTLDSLGVLATLRGMCRKFKTTYPSISVEQRNEIQEDDIPASLKIVIYRISQEALNNVGKHSRANRVYLSVEKREGKIELVVEDNGLGFDVNEALSMKSSEQGLGLISMRERAELSGGSFAIESIGGRGTSIRASWPCI